MPNLIGGIVLGYIWQILLNGILANFGKTLTYSGTCGFWGLVILMNWQQIVIDGITIGIVTWQRTKKQTMR